MEGSCCLVAFHFNPAQNLLQVGCTLVLPRRKQALDDPKTFDLALFQFQDSLADLSNLETLLVRFSPVSHLLCPELSDHATLQDKQIRQKLNHVCELLQLPQVSEYAKHKLAAEDGDGVIRQAVGEADYFPLASKLAMEEWKLAKQSCVSLLKSADFAFIAAGTAALGFDFLGSFMRLDSSTTRALNLFPEKGEVNKESSLFGMLDRCVTKKVGSRLLYKWIKYPLCDLPAITYRQTRVERLVNDTLLCSELRALLKSVPDLDAVSKRLAGGKSSLEDLYVVYLFAQKFPVLVNCVQGLEFLEELQRINELAGTGRFAQFCDFVENVLDLNAAPREFIVRSEHDDSGELGRLLVERDDLDHQLQLERDRLLHASLAELDAKWENDPKMIKTHGHHFRIPKKYDAALSKVKHGHTVLVVASGIRWTTAEVSQLSEQRAEVSAQYHAAQAQFVKEAIAVASSYYCLVDMVAQVVAELDCYASLAHVAANCPVGEYVKPTMTESSGSLLASDARHPLLELQHGVCESFIPNTHDMNRDSSRVQILTGPNMSGKSTFARQLGMLCVMAQIGSYVPCTGASPQMPIVDAVLARVGASDSQLAGVSTFMAEMNETSSILSTVTDRSLVIIDELGRGTSTYDGFGLAWAISEHLARHSRCLVIFATHFQELTLLADQVQGVTNIHVDATVTGGDALIMLHKVKPGKSEHSFGVNIARMAGFPPAVADNAQQKLDELDKFKGFVGNGEEEVEATRVLKKLRQLVEFADQPNCVDLAHQVLLQQD
ncbi:hypothetical protein BASA81_001236 [Batrachochytrium salamandrivorans]|nr:hypothetical protein BASA81_001236 [Batrachochytrium salamandrivorans]